MILTGKAKDDFLESNGKKEVWINIMLPIYQYALIIEWFDSVGIYVNALRYSLSEPNKWVVIKSLCENNLDFIYSSRQEATKQAIIKANEIYNERNII